MLNQTWPDKVIIEDFYQMTTTYEYMNWMKLTHTLLTFSLNPRAPFCTSTFPSTSLIAFVIYTLKEKRKRKRKSSPLCILCTLMPQIKPLLALKLVHMWYEESIPGRNPTLACCIFQYFGVSLFEFISYKKTTLSPRYGNHLKRKTRRC